MPVEPADIHHSHRRVTDCATEERLCNVHLQCSSASVMSSMYPLGSLVEAHAAPQPSGSSVKHEPPDSKEIFGGENACHNRSKTRTQQHPEVEPAMASLPTILCPLRCSRFFAGTRLTFGSSDGQTLSSEVQPGVQDTCVLASLLSPEERGGCMVGGGLICSPGPCCPTNKVRFGVPRTRIPTGQETGAMFFTLSDLPPTCVKQWIDHFCFGPEIT